jgi:hypothetical protein
MKKTKLNYPKETTWFVCFDDEKKEIKSYGNVTPSQCLETPWKNITFYKKESNWLKVLEKNDIDTEYLKSGI